MLVSLDLFGVTINIFSGLGHRFDVNLGLQVDKNSKNSKERTVNKQKRPVTVPTSRPTRKRKMRVTMRRRPIININGVENELLEEDRTTDILNVDNRQRNLKINRNAITKAPR